MAILDRQNNFANVGTPANAFGTAGTNVNLPDQIDLRQNRDIGSGENLFWFVQVATAFVGAGASVTFELVIADNEALSTNVEVVDTLGTFTVAQLGAGARYWGRISPSNITRTGRRYLGVRARSSGAATTAGAVVSGVTHSADAAHDRVYTAVQPFA